ncbi:hypothetical protein D3C75_1095900 [compost metagenome]
MVRRRRLLFQYVEHRRTELAAGQCLKQVLFYQVSAPAHVDQGSAFGQVLEQLSVENPFSLLGQWQDTKHYVALAEKRWKLLGTRKAVHSGNVVLAACPAR